MVREQGREVTARELDYRSQQKQMICIDHRTVRLAAWFRVDTVGRSRELCHTIRAARWVCTHCGCPAALISPGHARFVSRFSLCNRLTDLST